MANRKQPKTQETTQTTEQQWDFTGGRPTAPWTEDTTEDQVEVTTEQLVKGIQSVERKVIIQFLDGWMTAHLDKVLELVYEANTYHHLEGRLADYMFKELIAPLIGRLAVPMPIEKIDQEIEYNGHKTIIGTPPDYDH